MTKLFSPSKFLISLFHFAILIIIPHKTIFSQIIESGRPFIENFSPVEYGYESQNYSITQDDRGILYIGNLNGILEYNGESWKLIKVTGHPVLDVDIHGKVFVGGHQDFGYLDYNSENEKEFVSILNKLEKKYHSFGQVNKVITFENEVLFITDSHIFRYYDDLVEELQENDPRNSVFKVTWKNESNNITHVYLSSPDKGLMIYENGNFNLLINGHYLQDKYVTSILPYKKDELLIKSDDESCFYVYDHNSFKKFYSDVDEFLNINKVTASAKWNNYFIFATKSAGLVVIDNNGKFVTIANRDNSLIDESVIDIFIDANGNVWVALNYGIARIELNSNFSYYDTNYGIRGSVASIIRFKGTLYVATNVGVFYLDNSNHYDYKTNTFKINEFFQQVNDISADCYRFHILAGKLYVTSSSGVFRIVDTKGALVYQGKVRSIFQSKIDTTIMYVGEKEGLSIFKYEKNDWNFYNRLKNLNSEIRTIAETSEGIIWLGTDYNGVYKIDFSKGINLDITPIHFKKSNGLPDNERWIDVYNIATGVIFSTNNGIFRFDETQKHFYPDNKLGIDFSNSDRWVYPIVEDSKSNLWFSSGYLNRYEKMTGLIEKGTKSPKYNLVVKPFVKMKKFTVETIFPDIKNNITWFGGDEGLVRYYISNNSKSSQKKVICIINKVSVTIDSSFFESKIPKFLNANIINNINSPAVFNPDLSSILFSFAAPFFESKKNIKYQYFLENYDSKWSDWYERNYKEYTSLSAGTYTFRVRAKNSFDEISEEASFKFVIKRPFYNSLWSYFIYSLVLLTFILMTYKIRSYQFYRERSNLELTIRERTEELLKENERAEDLLVNMLPQQIAQELKSKGKATPEKFDNVTVLFADIQDFTRITEQVNPEILVSRLDELFYQFDHISEQFNIEKIKTMGDAYMCAGGIPEINRTNPVEVILAALEMQYFFRNFTLDESISRKNWGLRIGVHTGPVIAGVTGRKKYLYDIWGGTVNTANRMEQMGEIGQVNISNSTYECVKEYFICVPRGKIPVKHLGEIDMYFVKGFKPALYEKQSDKMIPNDLFNLKLTMLRLEDLKDFVIKKLQYELPEGLYYHNLQHTLDVYKMAEFYAKSEGVNDEDLLIIQTAALLHDIGFTVDYAKHENFSVKICNEILPKYKYSNEQIKKIGQLIQITEPPFKPKTLLEMIICDADLDYLGRDDFDEMSMNLYHELVDRKKIKSIEEWNKNQVKFIEKHIYYTKTAQKLRETNKLMRLENLRKMIQTA